MAIISGTTVNWALSPRVITISSPNTSVTIEDLQDTLLDLEDSEEGIIFPHLRNLSGGEDLGGGTTVGFTMELQNAQVAFEARTTITSSGTVTTANAAGTTLIDSGATFITDGVTAGATVYNTTDNSVATVISVDSETQLTMYALSQGTDNDWDSSDAYRVWNEVQCEVSGGNLVAVDGGGTPISPFFPTFGTQILRTSSSSATTQELADIQNMAFDNKVWIDQANTTGLVGSGTSFPAGTPRQPVDNIADALTIASSRGFGELFFIGNYTFDGTEDVTGYDLTGSETSKTLLTFNTNTVTIGCELRDCTVTGDLQNAVLFDNCHIDNLAGTAAGTGEVYFYNCVFDSGGMTWPSGQSGQVGFVNCKSGVAGTSTPFFDVNGSDTDILVRDWTGGIEWRNINQGQNISMDFHSGQCILASSVTSATITIRGICKLTDNSVGATVNDETFSATGVSSAVWDETMSDHLTAGSTGKTLKDAKNFSQLNFLK